MLEFKSVSENYFDLLFTWLNTGTVLKWYRYGKPISKDEIVKEYSPTVNLKTKKYIIVKNEVPVGFIKTYLIRDYPEYFKNLELNDNPAAFDIFIADTYQNQGIGLATIKQFIPEIIRINPVSNRIIIGPAQSNQRAINTYKKAGFKFLKLIKIPEEIESEYLMELSYPIPS